MTSRDPDRRATWITVAGVVAVIVGGAFAVGANLGILSASSDDRVGALAAAGDLVPASTDAVAGSSAPTTSGASRTFVIDTAGTVVVVDTDPLAVRSVSVNPGWAWNAAPSGAGGLIIRFSDSTRTLEFHATRTHDGQISAAVHEIAARQPTTADTATSRPARHDDDDEEHHEHEGRDDDD